MYQQEVLWARFDWESKPYSIQSDISIISFTASVFDVENFHNWDFLKWEYEENEKIKGMKVLILNRKFEMQRMKESKSAKEYSDRLINIANQIKAD